MQAPRWCGWRTLARPSEVIASGNKGKPQEQSEMRGRYTSPRCPNPAKFRRPLVLNRSLAGLRGPIQLLSKLPR